MTTTLPIDRATTAEKQTQFGFDEATAVREAKPPCILLAEDEDDLRHSLATLLRYDGYRVVELASGDMLAQRIWSAQIAHGEVDADLIISDIRMPGLTGMEMLSYLRMSRESVPVVLISAFATSEVRTKADNLGAVAVFHKPLDLQDFRAFIHHLFPPNPDHLQRPPG